MLFEAFTLTFVYKEALCDLEIRELTFSDEMCSWEIVQGGVSILCVTYKSNEWRMVLDETAHPVVKQDTEKFVSQELASILKQGIITHYDCFTNHKIKSPNS
jgi:hypothetical protein